MDDLETLLRAVRDEEVGAFENLVLGATDPLRRYIRSRGVAGHDAEDIAHDVLLIAARQLPSIDRPSLKAWLLKTASNLSLQHLRKQTRHPRTSLTRAVEIALRERTLSSAYRGAQLRQMLRQLVEKMPTPMRELALVDLDGGDLAEYAARTKRSPAAVRGLRKRYIDWLRRRFRGK